MLKTLRLGTKLLWRELRSGDWLVLFFALLFSVAVVTTLNFYTDRIQEGINQQSNRILGGDLAVVSASPIPVDWGQHATALGLKHAEVWSYLTIAKSNNQFQLVVIQAVSDDYPLLGNETSRPALKTLWLEPRLLPLLSVKENDSLKIGSESFTIARKITPDLDMLNTGIVIAPRILMRLKDVPATKTVLTGSRVDYRLLLTGNQAALDQYREWIIPKLVPGQRLVTVRDQQSYIRMMLDQAENYLQLILLICMVMSGVAIALSIHQYMRRHHAEVALWRCLGMERQRLISILIFQLTIIALLAGIAGVAVGFFAQQFLSTLFIDMLPFHLPSAGYLPILKGLVTSFFMLFAFSYPLIKDLPDTSPLYLWRGEMAAHTRNDRRSMMIMALMLFALLYWIMNMTLLTLFFIDVILISLGTLYATTIFLIKLTRYMLKWTQGAIRRGLSNLVQHAEFSGLQLTGITLILTCLFMLGFVRLSLIDQWKKDLPPATPNYFVFNIAPEDVPAMSAYFQQQGIALADIYPMVKGRMIKLNDQPIMSAIPAQARGHNTLHRELNLSWMWQYPADNTIIAGKQWTSADHHKAMASVEASMAKQLHLKLGDKLTFRIGDQEISATIINFRTLDWKSFHPNFYVIFPPGLLEHLPATYITSFFIAPDKASILNSLIQQFPNVTVLDVAGLLQQIQSLITKISLAVQYLFLFALGSSVLIMIVSIQASLDERRQTWKLIRILGASRRFMVVSLLAEFSYLFFLIFSIALALSIILAFFLSKNIFI